MLQHAQSAVAQPLVAGSVPQAGLMSWCHGVQQPSKLKAFVAYVLARSGTR
jgi:hypothetical protein